jgi:WhiB family redox-sensing transcriptional regulator
MALAACPTSGVDFYPGRGDVEGIKLARKVCATCLVREQCLDYALATGDKFGVWGGATARERQLIRRQRRLERLDSASHAEVVAITEPDVSANGGISSDRPIPLNGGAAEVVVAELPPLPPPKTCRGCGVDISHRRRAVWCSNACRHRWEYKHRGEEKAAVGSLDSLTLARLLAIAVPEGVTFSVEVGGVTISAYRE